MCYSSTWKKIILYGGVGVKSPCYFDDTWSYDGKDWTEIECENRPEQRYKATMVFDESLQKVILFGGQAKDGAYIGNCYLFDGNNWEYLPLCGGGEAHAFYPLGRRDTKMIWDPVRKRIVLFGGEMPFMNTYGDTWEFYNKKWHKVHTNHHPHARTGIGLTYYKPIGKCVLFGGVGYSEYGSPIYYNDIWEYDGNDWKKIEVNNPPVARKDMVFEYFNKILSIYMFGGNSVEDSIEYFGDTWKYSVVRPATELTQ
jgi:N-acetylneuraminic acid mutarotase